jgi:two-component system, OmpR family, response regulator
MRILLVEDDEEIARRLIARLLASGFMVEHAEDGQAALDIASPGQFSAIILDLGLPDINGLELVRQWRASGVSAPILILSARGTWEEKVAALNLGADDYVVKPARAEELAARLHALLRRASGQSNPIISAGNVRIDPTSKEVFLNDNSLSLTQMEYRLLVNFVMRAGHLISQFEILDYLYPMDSERDLNTIEVHIGRLRRKIGKDAITTVRGLGYRFER